MKNAVGYRGYKNCNESEEIMINTKKNRNNGAWEYALGMIKIDGLEPSSEFLEYVEKEKKGEITDEDIIKMLNQKYRMKVNVPNA